MTQANRCIACFRRISKKYHDTTHYIAIVVTFILILQLVSMAKGSN